MTLDPQKFVDAAISQAGAARPAPARAPLTWIDITSWDGIPVPDRDWLVRDRIPVRQPTLFSGEGAVGKSYVTLHLLAATALGRDWLGMLPEQGPAWYIGAEDDKTELHIRLAAIQKHYDVTFSELAAAGFRMASLFGEDAVLGAPNRSGIIEPTTLYQQIFEAAADEQPKCIVIDASADVFAGDEINRSQVRQFVGLLRRLAGAADGAVVLLSHPSLTGINSGSGISGSTAWHNSVRARMYLTSQKPEAGEQPDTDLRELTFKKNNYGPIGASVTLRYRNGLFLPEGNISSFEQAARAAAAEEVFLAGLKRLIEQGHIVSPQVQSTYCAARLITKLDKDKKFRIAELEAAQQRLLDAKRIHIRVEGKPSKQQRRLYPGPPPNAPASQHNGHPLDQQEIRQ
jgi:RecA-family ATPase